MRKNNQHIPPVLGINPYELSKSELEKYKYAVCIYYTPTDENVCVTWHKTCEEAKEQYHSISKKLDKKEYYVELWPIPKNRLIGNKGEPILKSDK